MIRILLLTTLLCLAIGCATSRTDWNAKVGNYTYDEAVLELGVPDRSARLSDGTTVAEWLRSRGSSYSTYHAVPGSYWMHTLDHHEFPDNFLRLTFGPDGKLSRWQRVNR
jgi:hypothetical protein